MTNLTPINQINLFGLNRYFDELIFLHQKKCLPSKILLSGQKGIGKSTLAYHFINYVLSMEEEFKYDADSFKINVESNTYKTILNKSNPNFILIDIDSEKKSIDINQIRSLISNLNKSSFNDKPRFVLIDNIEFLNVNSINAMLKTLEEPNLNVHFILINNNKKIISTLLSRCINFNVSLSKEENLNVADLLLNGRLNEIINKDLINYYSTPGKIYNLVKFAENNNYDLMNTNLKDLLKLLINDSQYKQKDELTKNLLFELIELYFVKINLSFSLNINNKYSHFLKRASDTKKFNLDQESLFMEFKDDILNG